MTIGFFVRTAFSWMLQGIFMVVVAYFAIYVVLELRVLLIARKAERCKLTTLKGNTVSSSDFSYPLVTVLLPICNESSVVERLIDSICQLDYPDNLLEILVLDDSNDLTSSIAEKKVFSHAVLGKNIRLLRRNTRDSYKAGNLINGIKVANGEFLAIFDADFLPPADFLLQTIPRFSDPVLGFLQTGIGYENWNKSFLTRFQAMEMGHQQYVTVGLSEDGDMASLSGSSCVWRRSCVDALGGWNASTVTEDVDLSYRAQFGNWKYAYLREIVSISILPETISAFRVQRERWGRGLIHSGFKHARDMFYQPMSFMKRLHAISMMFSSALLASIYLLVLLSLPLNYLVEFEGTGLHWFAIGFFGLVGIWALDNIFGANKGAGFNEKPRFLPALINTYLYVAMFLPMAWYYFAGGIRALWGVYGDFERTPKGKDERRLQAPKINSHLILGEVVTFFYSAITVIVAFVEENYFLIPLNVTVCVGFGMVLFWTWQEECKHVKEY